MSLAELADRAGAQALVVLGTCPAVPSDEIGTGTIVLLGPLEPGFWPHVTTAPEFADGRQDPLDRWSARVVTALATKLGGEPLFPFGTPVHPFIGWALRSGRAWASPVGLLVHDTAGLMVSYRGAILLGQTLAPAPPVRSPCETCADKPCQTSCPVDALHPAEYRLADCHGYLDTAAGTDCLTKGCAARRACPISAAYGRSEAQSAYHMRQFHPTRGKAATKA